MINKQKQKRKIIILQIISNPLDVFVLYVVGGGVQGVVGRGLPRDLVNGGGHVTCVMFRLWALVFHVTRLLFRL